MKRILTLLLVCASLFGYAQKFQLTDLNGNPYTDGEKISATITENDLTGPFNDFYVEIMVKNLYDFEQTVNSLRENIKLVDGMVAFVCFGVCDDPETGGQLEMECLIDGDASAIFSLHLVPKDKYGLSQFKIVFSVEGQSMTLYIDIDMTHVGVKEQNNDKVSLSAYPNPVQAGSKINVSYTLTDKSSNNKLVIRNILGAEVMSFPLNPYETTISVNIASLVQGVYFYAIENKNQISIAKKLLVK